MIQAPSSSGLGHWVLIPETGVQFPVGSQTCLQKEMKDRHDFHHRAWPDRGPFQDAATAYIRFSESKPVSWTHLEEPAWRYLFELPDLNLQNLWILDVGSGVGKVVDLAIELGANKEQIFSFEPNSIMADYLFKKGLQTIKDQASNLDNPIIQNEEFDLVTANMVLNHFPTNEFVGFIQTTYGILKKGGGLVYTVPHPGSKAHKHGFDYDNNSKVIEEKAPWGGYTQYNHRSVEFQAKTLEECGYDIVLREIGYSDFCTTHQVATLESELRKSLEGPKRIMVIGTKPEQQ